MPEAERDWDGVRLHVVTGKGGTGKTTVAAALALSLASDGRRVLLAEVEGRQGIAQLFDVPPLPYAERKIAAFAGGEVLGLAVDPKAAPTFYGRNDEWTFVSPDGKRVAYPSVRTVGTTIWRVDFVPGGKVELSGKP